MKQGKEDYWSDLLLNLMLLLLFVVPAIGGFVGYCLRGNWGLVIGSVLTALLWSWTFGMIMDIWSVVLERRKHAERRLGTKDADREEILRELWGDRWESHR